MVAQTRYEQMLGLIERETFWSGGSDRPWEGDALVSPWFLKRLALLAANAPQFEITKLIEECAE